VSRISHYTVLVIGDDVEGQLAPYDESISVVPYKRYERPDWEERWSTILSDYKDGDSNSKDGEYSGEKLLSNPEEATIGEIVAVYNARYGDEEPVAIDDTGVYHWSTYNPDSRWDWYEVGGRWRGYFKLKEAALDRAAVAEVGMPGVFDNEPRYDADVVSKGDVDVDGMRDAAGEAAGKRWDCVRAVVGDAPPPIPWRQVLEESANIEEARRVYREQDWPRLVAVHDKKCRSEKRHKGVPLLGFFGNVEEFSVTRDEYVQQARDSAIVTYAYVRDGRWFAPGEMGWWGCSTDEDEDRLRFAREFNEMFDGLPDDTLLTVCDLHI